MVQRQRLRLIRVGGDGDLGSQNDRSELARAARLFDHDAFGCVLVGGHNDTSPRAEAKNQIGVQLIGGKPSQRHQPASRGQDTTACGRLRGRQRTSPPGSIGHSLRGTLDRRNRGSSAFLPRRCHGRVHSHDRCASRYPCCRSRLPEPYIDGSLPTMCPPELRWLSWPLSKRRASQRRVSIGSKPTPPPRRGG
jgi:hypothetical protein